MDALARAYYRAIDEEEYDALFALLAPDFTHDRPDQTIDGREAFIQFMREKRPETDTAHEIADVFRNEHTIAVRGELVHDDGEEWFEFVDVFTVEDESIVSLKTYSGSTHE